MKPVGILAALELEITSLIRTMKTDRIHRFGLRDFHEGEISGRPCVAVFSRVGKVSSAATTADLISRFEVSEIIFTGVAGGIHSGVNVGDVVVGTSLIQHDLDARPLFPRYVVPYLGMSEFSADPRAVARLRDACESFFNHDLPEAAKKFGISNPQIHEGLVTSGDQFFSSSESVARLRSDLPQALCVEMEGAAVAQVCYEHGIPFSTVRTISDSADDQAHVDFPKFVKEIATAYSLGIVKNYLKTT